MFRNIVYVLLGQRFHKYFYLQFYSADNQALVKVHKHIASPTQYCSTLEEKSAVIINNLWYLCEAPIVDWHHTKRFSAIPAQCSGRRLFRRHLAPAGPEMQLHSVPICKNFPCEGLAYKGILLFLTCEQANPSAIWCIPLFSLYSSVSLEFEISLCKRARTNKLLSVMLLSNSLIQVFRQNAFIFLLFWTFVPFW